MDGRVPWPRWKLGDLYESNECPRRAITDDTCRWLDLYPHYVKGHLFTSGGVADQPALYLEAMKVIAAAVAQARADG